MRFLPHIAGALVGLILLICSLSAHAEVPPLPEWATAGRSISDDWIVTDVFRHPEFVRLRVVHKGGETGVEIRWRDPETASTDKWSTGHYQLQSAPGTTAPEELLQTLFVRLQEDEANNRQPFVQSKTLAGAGNETVGPGLQAPFNHNHNHHASSEIIRGSDGSTSLRQVLFSPPAILAMVLLLFGTAIMFLPGVFGRSCRRTLKRIGNGLWIAVDEYLGGFRKTGADSGQPSGRTPHQFSLIRDVLWLVLIAVPVFIGLRFLLPHSMPIQIDMAREMLIAHNLHDLGTWPSLGGSSSFNGLYHGSIVILLWRTLLELNIDLEMAYPIMMAANAMAVAVIFVGFRRRAGVLTAAMAACIYLYLDLTISVLTNVWGPSLLPLPLALFFVAIVSFATRPTWIAAVAGGISLALAAEAHVFAVVLFPALLFALGTSGIKRAMPFCLLSIGATIATMMLLSPKTWIADAGIMVRSGWLIPATSVMILTPIAGIALSRRFTQYGSKMCGVYVSHLVTIFTLLALILLSLFSGRRLEIRYCFILAPGIAVLAAQGCAWYLRTMAAQRNLIRLSAMLGAALCVLYLLHPVSRFHNLRTELTPTAPSFDTFRQATAAMSKKGVTRDDMKWAVQTLEYAAFIRLLRQYVPQHANSVNKWKSEPVFQLLRLIDPPETIPRLDGLSWFASGHGDGLLMEELRPWVIRDQVEICFENVAPSSGEPGCARFQAEFTPDESEDASNKIARDEQLGPLQVITEMAWKSFKPAPNSITRVTYRIPLHARGDDIQREVRLVDEAQWSDATAHMTTRKGWWITGVEGMSYQGSLPTRAIVLKKPLGTAEVSGMMIIQSDFVNESDSSLQSVPPTWFEVRPGREFLYDASPIWSASTDGR